MKKMKTVENTKLKAGKYLFIVVILLAGGRYPVAGQLLDVKPWTGAYPEMNDDYPLAFLSFQGWLVPVPHVFVRTWPTHYYVDAVSVPVTDAPEIAGETETGLVRIVEKLLERHQMEGRYNETEGIKLNTGLSKEIAQKIFDSRKEKLNDHFQLSAGFIRLYESLDKLGQEVQKPEVRKIFEREADDLLVRFLMVNNLGTGQGEKLDAFSDISAEQNKLLGEIDYTIEKVRFFNRFHPVNESGSYTFLTR